MFAALGFKLHQSAPIPTRAFAFVAIWIAFAVAGVEAKRPLSHPQLVAVSTTLTVSSSPVTVTVSGSDLQSGLAPTIGTASAVSSRSFSWTLTPSQAGTLSLQVTNPDGQRSNLISVTVSAPAPPPPPAPPTLACPAPQSGTSSDGSAVAVNYPAPVVTGGASPVTASCLPPSGSAFGLGTTTVTCTATDALLQKASCSFPVTIAAAVNTGSTDPTAWPLLQQANVSYVGAFRLPRTSMNGAFDFGGSPMAFNPANRSLFVGNYYSQIAEVTIPTPVNSPVVSDLPFAGYKQGFADPVEGHLADVGSGVELHGLLVSDGSLYGTASVYYDANNDQAASHYRRSTTLSAPSFSGFQSVWHPTSADVANGVPSVATGYASGYLASVPSAWQPLLGGSAIAGQWGLPIVWRESYGPDAIVWNPSDLGNTVAGAGLMYYTGIHATLGPWQGASALWGGTATSGGAVLVDGTRTALFFGRNGLGTFCYGEGTADQSLAGTVNPSDGATYCYDPTSSDKGQHAYPYVYEVWAYDMNDWVAVKNGSKQPWAVVPYATWRLDLPTPAGGNGIGDVAYDPLQRLLYVSQLRADPDGFAYRAVIHVLKIQ